MVLDPSFPEPEMPRTARALADGDLSRWMHWLLTAHVRRYQRHYHATGHVWQGRFKARHGSKAGYSSGVAGVDARRATPPDPRPPRWGLAGCCQLDPSHPTIVTCAVGREGRHAPRPNDVGGQPRFPGARKGVTLPLLVISGLATGPPAGVGDGLRFLSHALTTLLSALGAFGLLEPRGARICPRQFTVHLFR